MVLGVNEPLQIINRVGSRYDVYSPQMADAYSFVRVLKRNEFLPYMLPTNAQLFLHAGRGKGNIEVEPRTQ
jgi:hypothetical protein